MPVDSYSGPIPTLAQLLGDDIHLWVSCGKCRREKRIGAVAARRAFGDNATVLDVARAARCSACGARGREKAIQAYPCTMDMSARRSLLEARRDHAARQDPATSAKLHEAEAEWEFLRSWDGDLWVRSDFVQAQQGRKPLSRDFPPAWLMVATSHRARSATGVPPPR